MTKSNNMSTPVLRIRDLFRRLGTADAVLHIIGKIAQKLSLDNILIRRYYVFLQTVDQIVILPNRRGRSVNVRLIESDDPIIHDFPRPELEIAERFRCGSECLVAEFEGKLSGFFWLHFEPYDDPEANVQFHLHPRSVAAWDFDMYVEPAHRGGWTFAKLWSCTGKLLRERSIQSSVSLVWYDNEVSITSHRRMGAFPIFSAYHLQIGRTVLHIAGTSPRMCLIRPCRKKPTFHFDTSVPTCKSFSRFRDQG